MDIELIDRQGLYMLQSIRAKPISIAIALLPAVFIVIGKKQLEQADALWKNVHGRCIPNMLTNHVPAPCAMVSLPSGEEDGFVVWKDSVGNSQYLVMPTKKITGIESLEILLPNAENYFADAWAVTALVNQQLHQRLPHTYFALAINSVSGRSQNQLHIHVDCIQPKVKSALEQIGTHIAPTWQALPVKLMGHDYRAIWLPGAELGPRNPFQLLAKSLANPEQEMGRHTLVLVGAERKDEPGFILLDGEAPLFAFAVSPWIKLGFGSGEELEDHSCQIAHDKRAPLR
jgi:CDP-diacylglycerol pyrophosphatase